MASTEPKFNEKIDDSELYDDNEILEETWQDGLEGQSLDIVKSEANRQCVQAGPGTGKSYCMTRRILRLIQQQRVKPEEVLAITFTRTAANDLRKSLATVLGKRNSNFRASTLHSLCFNILEEENFLQNRNRHPRFLLAVTKSGCLNFEAAPMLSDLQHENSKYGGAREQTKRLKAFEAMWARHQNDPVGIAANPIDAVYGTSLLNWLRFHHGMMIGELVKEAYEFMSGEPNTKWRHQYKAILIDEYQDLNKLDQDIVDLLCEANDNICSVVGDLDQSIYSFRCAHPEGLIDYGKRSNVEFLTMSVSWRCPKKHLSAAQIHIHKNINKADKYPQPCTNAIDGELFIRRWADREAEVKGVVEFVKHSMTQGIPMGEILVMVPSRIVGKEIRKVLEAEGIKAKSYFAEEQLEETEAQKAFTLLTLLANKDDKVSLRCWLGGWTNQHRRGNYKVLRDYCEKFNDTPWAVLEKVVSGTLSLQGIHHLISPFKELCCLLESLEGCTGQELLDKVFPPNMEWAEDIRTLTDGFIESTTSPQKLYGYLADCITQPVLPTEVDYIRVMSLHKAKGLTVRASAIAGCVEGLVPRIYDPDKSFLTQSEHLEEQRRLLYVAMTRSTEFLLICSAQVVDSAFAKKYQLPVTYKKDGFHTQVSSFLSGMGLPSASTSFTFVHE